MRVTTRIVLLQPLDKKWRVKWLVYLSNTNIRKSNASLSSNVFKVFGNDDAFFFLWREL